MEKPNSLKQKEATVECRKTVLELIKILQNNTSDEFEKEAFKEIAKDIVEAPNMKKKLFALSVSRDDDEDWEAMF